MKNAIITLVVVLVAAPFVVPVIAPYMPKPMTLERVTAAFDSAGYTVEGLTKQSGSYREGVEQWNFYIAQYTIELHRYDHEGKIVRNVANLQDDGGSVMVEAWNLSEQLGAAHSRNRPMLAARKRMWMILVTGPDRAYCQQLIRVFKSS